MKGDTSVLLGVKLLMNTMQLIYVFSYLSVNCGCKHPRFQTNQELSIFITSWKFWQIINLYNCYAILLKAGFYFYPEMPYLIFRLE